MIAQASEIFEKINKRIKNVVARNSSLKTTINRILGGTKKKIYRYLINSGQHVQVRLLFQVWRSTLTEKFAGRGESQLIRGLRRHCPVQLSNCPRTSSLWAGCVTALLWPNLLLVIF